MGVTTAKFLNDTESIEPVSNNPQNSLSPRVTNGRQKSLYNINKFVVVWLDINLNDSDIIYRNSIARLQRISVVISTFTNIKECIQFLSKVKDSKVLMVVSDSAVNEIWPCIKPMKHIHSVYIITENGEKKDYPEHEYNKIKGIFDRVDPIYNFLKRDTRQYQQDILVISIIPSGTYSKKDLKQLNQLFIYWYLVKKIILDMKYDKEAHKRLAQFCRTHYTENNSELEIIDEYEKNYHDHSPIWWYTRQCFIHIMLNRAFQTQDIEVIIKMGPFIQDLHRKLEELKATTNETSILLYRTQTLSNEDFEKIKTSQENLLSFNNFMLADTDYKTSLEGARRARANTNAIGLLFQIEVGSNRTTTPFASLKNLSYFVEEETYFMFSMHSVFRIVEIKQIEDRLWQIKLQLTEINDKQIISFNELIQEETRDVNGWYKLAKLMSNIRDFDHAKEIYFVLLDLLSENDLSKMSYIYNELGLISDEMGDYILALSFYQKAIESRQKSSTPNHRLLSIAYNNIGEVQRELGDYFNALSSHKKTLRIKQKTLSPNHLSIATTYNNLGLANESLGEYSTALEFYQKSLEIKRKVLSPNHIELAITYNNMGELQREMGHYPSALNYFEKALQIRLKTSSPYDSSLSVTYNNIGLIHREMGDYAQAISYFQKSLDIKQKTFATHHPSLAITYNNIGEINQLMGKFSEALSTYQKALEIQEKAFSLHHPELAVTYNNLGVTHQSLGNYSTALSFYQKALKIRQKSLPVNHPSLATSYNNIGHLNQLMGDYNTALENYQKTQRLQEKSLRPHHPSLASTYNNIGDVQRQLGNHKMALSLYKKSLEIKKKSLAPNHPTLIITYNNIGVMHQAMQEYSSALEYYKKTLEVQQKSLPSNHPDLAAIYNNIGVAYQSMKEYSTALENYQQALKIHEKALSANHPDLAAIHNSIATAYVGMGNIEKAAEHEQLALDIATQTLPPDHPYIQTFTNYLERIKVKIESTQNT